MKERFKHSQYAHCESGVVSSMLTNSGLAISEPMAFGLTRSLSFAFLPIIKVSNMPLIAYRAMPRHIINSIEKVLQVKIGKQKFTSALEASLELDKKLDDGMVVGLQTSVYYLPYMPKDMRFHFNAHNLLVYEKCENIYKISDPVFEDVVECSLEDLTKARFAKGIFAPKGFMYYVKELPRDIDLSKSIKKSIKKNASSMLTPFPYAGIKGMRTLAKAIEKLQNRDERYVKNYLTHIVRMQEEIGTGGGGFRYLYAAFLEEAKGFDLDWHKLDESCHLMVASGDALREFALKCVEGARNIGKFDAKNIAKALVQASEYEERAYKILKSL
ncbi:MAG: BtrH N-terminal domain-containing protein [Sulfuricurvum sp.]